MGLVLETEQSYGDYTLASFWLAGMSLDMNTVPQTRPLWDQRGEQL